MDFERFKVLIYDLYLILEDEGSRYGWVTCKSKDTIHAWKYLKRSVEC